MPVLLIVLAIIAAITIVHTLLYLVFPRKQQPVFPELKKPLMLTHQGG